MKSFTIALAGNPNCGKTTLFNALTRTASAQAGPPPLSIPAAARGRAKTVAVMVDPDDALIDDEPARDDTADLLSG